jgi:hypothetical protein
MCELSSLQHFFALLVNVQLSQEQLYHLENFKQKISQWDCTKIRQELVRLYKQLLTQKAIATNPNLKSRDIDAMIAPHVNNFQWEIQSMRLEQLKACVIHLYELRLKQTNYLRQQ